MFLICWAFMFHIFPAIEPMRRYSNACGECNYYPNDVHFYNICKQLNTAQYFPKVLLNCMDIDSSNRWISTPAIGGYQLQQSVDIDSSNRWISTPTIGGYRLQQSVDIDSSNRWLSTPAIGGSTELYEDTK